MLVPHALQIFKSLLELVDALSITHDNLDKVAVNFVRVLASIEVAHGVTHFRVHLAKDRVV